MRYPLFFGNSHLGSAILPAWPLIFLLGVPLLTLNTRNKGSLIIQEHTGDPSTAPAVSTLNPKPLNP